MRFIIIAILVFSLQKGFTQTAWQMPFDSTSRWKTGCDYSLNGGHCVDHENYEYYVSGDTLVNNNTYEKLYFNYIHSQQSFNCTNYANPCLCCQYECTPIVQMHSYAGGLRGDSGKIYLLPPTKIKDTLLYDFTLSIGDTLPPSYIHDTALMGFRVIQIDTLLVGTQYRRKFILSPFYAGCFLNDTATWMIEGIGHRQGLLSPIFCEFEIGCGIDCYSELGKTIFPDTSSYCDFTIGIPEMQGKENNFYVYPTPVINELTMRWDNNQIREIIIVNMLGEKIYTSEVKNKSELFVNVNSFSSGMYLIQAEIENGLIMKKFLKE